MAVSTTLLNQSIQFVPRLLAEALRDLLDASPSDLLLVPGLGTLMVERAWLPIYKLEDQTEIVLSILSDDDSGTTFGRNLACDTDIDIGFSLQKLISVSPQTLEGKAEIDAVHDFSERCLRAAYVPVTAAGVKWQPQRFQRTRVDETLTNWNQVSIVFGITYKAVK